MFVTFIKSIYLPTQKKKKNCLKCGYLHYLILVNTSTEYSKFIFLTTTTY